MEYLIELLLMLFSICCMMGLIMGLQSRYSTMGRKGIRVGWEIEWRRLLCMSSSLIWLVEEIGRKEIREINWKKSK